VYRESVTTYSVGGFVWGEMVGLIQFVVLVIQPSGLKVRSGSAFGYLALTARLPLTRSPYMLSFVAVVVVAFTTRAFHALRVTLYGSHFKFLSNLAPVTVVSLDEDVILILECSGLIKTGLSNSYRPFSSNTTTLFCPGNFEAATACFNASSIALLLPEETRIIVVSLLLLSSSLN
jgi:hypothetical protein